MPSATVFVLPVMRSDIFKIRGDELVHRDGVDLSQQRLLPSSDRRNVIELWRVFAERVGVDLGKENPMSDPTADQLRHQAAARGHAARMLFKGAGVVVEELDQHHWQVAENYLFWPVSGYWRRLDGTPQGGGAHDLVAAIRRDGTP